MECEADAQGVGTHFPIATTLAQSAILRPKLWERVRMMINDSRQYAPATLRNRDFILGILRDVLPRKGVILTVAAVIPLLSARSESSLSSSEGAQPRLRLLHLVVRETEFCGLRLAGDFRRRTREKGRNSIRRPQHPSLTDRNCEGICRPGNRVGLPGLHGGGCRNRTDGPSLQNEAACRGFSARNDLSQRMSKSLAGKPKALTMNRYLPVSLRFHSLSSRSRAMVVTCSRALRRLQE